jgi:hypothetical protein
MNLKIPSDPIGDTGARFATNEEERLLCSVCCRPQQGRGGAGRAMPEMDGYEILKDRTH